MLKKIYYWFHRRASSSGERGEYSSGAWQGRIRKETLILCRAIYGKVLEVGCGEGLFLTQLARQNPGLEIWGVDNNEKRLNAAEERLRGYGPRNINLSVQDARRLSFPDEYFDAIICINVIFNLGNKEAVRKALREIARVCKKNGRVVFDFRNRKNPLLYLKYKLAPFYDRTIKDLPLRTYFLEEIRGILYEAGLKEIHRKYIGLRLKNLAPIIILETKKI